MGNLLLWARSKVSVAVSGGAGLCWDCAGLCRISPRLLKRLSLADSSSSSSGLLARRDTTCVCYNCHGEEGLHYVTWSVPSAG